GELRDDCQPHRRHQDQHWTPGQGQALSEEVSDGNQSARLRICQDQSQARNVSRRMELFYPAISGLELFMLFMRSALSSRQKAEGRRQSTEDRTQNGYEWQCCADTETGESISLPTSWPWKFLASRRDFLKTSVTR